MPPFLRLFLGLLLLGFAFLAGGAGAFASLDRLLLDWRFEVTERPASGRVVFVDIDGASLAEIGVWPWPRQLHAELLDRLMAADAAAVAFDIDFSTRSNAEADAALAAALERAGGYAYLAAFRQAEGASGGVMLNAPLPEFLGVAEPVLVNVTAGELDLVERVPTGLATADGFIPSLAVRLADAGPDLVHGDAFGVDFGIAPESIPRFSAARVLAGEVPDAAFAGRQVIIGASAIELGDRHIVPRLGNVPGPLLQALATETLIAGRPLQPVGLWPEALVALGMLVAGLALRRRPVHLVAIATALAAGLAEGTALLLHREMALTLATAPLHVALLLLLGLHLADRLRTELASRRGMQERLAYLARHDAVTGLLNRYGLIEKLAARPGPVTVVAVGLQRLDIVRNALGQQVYETALRRVADRLSTRVPGEWALIATDRLALLRAGGASASEEDTADLLHALRETLQQSLVAEGHEVFVDLAVGLASIDYRADEDARRVLDRAQLALEMALSHPQGEATPFAAAHEQAVERRRRLDSGLRNALSRGQLRVVYQPQFRLEDHVLVGVEALVRWEDAELGVVPPNEFIPLAEETGLIVPLGAFVLGTACREVASWPWRGRLAVNLSQTQIQFGDVPATVETALAASGLPAARLDIELTESLLLARDERTALALAALRRIGTGLAIDDFGTGYSSLGYLADLDFDKLKIDRSFVAGAEQGGARRLVLETILELSHRLGKTTICEGVETAAQAELLRQLGCEIGQGYLYGHPMAAEEVLALIGPAPGERVRA